MAKTPPKGRANCPCGSGKSYKHCCALRDQQGRRRRKRLRTWIGRSAAGAGIGLALWFAASRIVTEVPYGEADLTPVDFSGLTPDQKNDVLLQANRARCNCGCGMTLAQCVATDSTCPVRTGNIDRIRSLVDAAGS